MIGSVAVNAALGGGTYLVNCEIEKKDIDPMDCAVATLIGGVSGFVGGKGTSASRTNGIIQRSKEVISTAKSASKVAKYTAKIQAQELLVRQAKKRIVASVTTARVSSYLYQKSKRYLNIFD